MPDCYSLHSEQNIEIGGEVAAVPEKQSICRICIVSLRYSKTGVIRNPDGSRSPVRTQIHRSQTQRCLIRHRGASAPTTGSRKGSYADANLSTRLLHDCCRHCNTPFLLLSAMNSAAVVALCIGICDEECRKCRA